MHVVSLGKIAVPTPGTPVSLDPTGIIRCHTVGFAQILSTTGRTVVGLSGQLNKTTRAGAIHEFLATGSATILDKFEIPVRDTSSNSLTLGDFCVDADVANEGLIVYYTQV